MTHGKQIRAALQTLAVKERRYDDQEDQVFTVKVSIVSHLITVCI